MSTVPTDVSELDFTGNAATVAFPIPFPIIDKSDLVVTKTLNGSTTEVAQVLGVDFTVDAAPSDAPTVTFLVAPENLSTVHVERTRPLTQLKNLLTQGAMSPATFTQMADDDRMIDQQLERRIASLEALGSLVSLEDLDAAVVTVGFATAADVVNTFVGGAIHVAVPVGFNVTGVVVMKVAGGAGGQESVQVRDWSVAAGVLTLGFVTGLEPATDYTLTLLLLNLVT